MLGRLGGTGAVLDQQLAGLSKAPLAALKQLKVAYGAALVEANKYAKTIADARTNLPPFGSNPTPKAARLALASTLGQTYFEAPKTEHPSASDPLRALLDPKRSKGAKLCRLLQTNASVRAKFEKIAGGVVALDGRGDGTVSMLPAPKKGTTAVATSAMTASGGLPSAPSRDQVYEYLSAMDAAVMKAAAEVQAAQAQQNGTYDTATGSVDTGAFSSLGKGSLLGKPLDGSDEDESSEDEDNEHSVKMQSLALDASTGLGEKLNTVQMGNNSVDASTLQLKRLMDKRDQMYELYRQTVDKYGQSATKAIDAMRA
ncbi:hypothetical protein L6R52_24170 [Myxococcota bacterium]|nr:hypothetical protein [Myxococcota bacterium]